MEKKILYFDCFSGISGDMSIGALLDLGVNKDYLIENLNKLNLKGYQLEIKKGMKKGITGTDFSVIIKKHHNEHNHEGHHHHHSRNLSDINKIIDDSELNENIKNLSKKIFLIIGEAEAKIHSKSINEIHFHEIGAVDSIVDIIGFSICLDSLNVDEILSSPVNIGGGFVECEHGIMPVPAPASLEILKGVPVYSNGIRKELTTPTGAGILKAICNEFVDFPEIEIEKIGYGLGKRDFEKNANLLRIVLGKKKIKKNY